MPFGDYTAPVMAADDVTTLAPLADGPSTELNGYRLDGKLNKNPTGAGDLGFGETKSKSLAR